MKLESRSIPVVAGCFVIFRPFLKVEGKSSTQGVRFFKFTCQKKMSECLTVLNLKNFLKRYYSKCAVDCDWNRKISQIRMQFGPFSKKMGFWKKNLNFFKIGKGGWFAEKSVSNDIILKSLFQVNWGFENSQKIFIFWKVRKFDGVFCKSNAFIFLKLIYNKSVRRKISRLTYWKLGNIELPNLYELAIWFNFEYDCALCDV